MSNTASTTSSTAVEYYARWILQFKNDLTAVPPAQRLQWAKHRFGQLPDPPRTEYETLFFAGGDVVEYQRAEWQHRERMMLMIFAGVLVVFLAVVAIAIPNPTPTTFWILRLLATFDAGAIGAFLPGSLNVMVKRPSFTIRAAGALGLAIIVYLVNPPALAAGQPRP